MKTWKITDKLAGRTFTMVAGSEITWQNALVEFERNNNYRVGITQEMPHRFSIECSDTKLYTELFLPSNFVLYRGRRTHALALYRALKTFRGTIKKKSLLNKFIKASKKAGGFQTVWKVWRNELTKEQRDKIIAKLGVFYYI